LFSSLSPLAPFHIPDRGSTGAFAIFRPGARHSCNENCRVFGFLEALPTYQKMFLKPPGLITGEAADAVGPGRLSNIWRAKKTHAEKIGGIAGKD